MSGDLAQSCEERVKELNTGFMLKTRQIPIKNSGFCLA